MGTDGERRGGKEGREGRTPRRTAGERNQIGGKKSEKGPTPEQERGRRADKQTQRRRKREKGRGEQGGLATHQLWRWQHVGCGTLAILSWVSRALFTLSPFNTDLS